MTDLLVKSLRQFYLARDSGVKWAIWRDEAPEDGPIRRSGARNSHWTPPQRDLEIYLALARLDIAIGAARHYRLLIDFRPDDLDLLW
jgi:hypothetical protein